MRRVQLLLLFGPVVAAQTPVFQSETRIVQIPVIARDSRNSPVLNLKKRDLRLFDNGIEQSVLTLDSFGGPRASAGEGASDDRVTGMLGPRLSIILLDQLNTPLEDQLRGNDGISGMLRKLSAAQERIAIYSLSDDLHLLCNFTDDLDILRGVLENFKAEYLPIGATTPPRGAALVPDPFHYAERRLEITLNALRAMARRLHSLPGEKSLIWMTAAFMVPKDPQLFYAAVQQLRDAKVRLYPIDARGLIACTPQRTGPACPPWVNEPIAMMQEMAVQTGGRAYHDSNGLAALARTALDDSRQGYLLTYAPQNYSRDGSTHRVELQTSRKNVNLRYRSGYVADLPAGR